MNQVLAFLFVAAFSAAVLGYYHDRFWWPPDDATNGHIADRILGGEVLNRDIGDVHPGYHHFANALAFVVFGDDLVSLRYPLAAMGFVQSCLVFLLLLPRGILAAAAASVSLTSLSLVQYLNPAAHWYCMFLLVVIVGVLAWCPRESRWRLEVLGFLIVTMFLVRQLTGVFMAIGVLTYLLCEAPRGASGADRLMARALVAIMAAGLGGYLLAMTQPVAAVMFGVGPLGILVWAWSAAAVANRRVLRLLSRLALGGAVAAAPLVLYHVVNASLGAWFHDTVVSAMALPRHDFIGAIHYGLYPLLGLHLVTTFESAAVVVNGAFWSVLPLLPLALGFLVLRTLHRGGKTGTAPHPLPFLAVFYALVSLHYQIPIYLFFSIGLTLAGLVWMTAGGSSWRRYFPLVLAGTLSAIGLVHHAAQPLSRTFEGTLRGDRIPLVRSRGLDRVGLWIEAADVELYGDLVALIERETGPEETILAIPVNPELYFLTRRRNPFRFFNSAFALLDDDDVKSARATLAREPPRLVFHRPGDKYNTAFSDKLMAFIKQRYTLLEKRDGFEIYLYGAGKTAPRLTP